VSILMPEVEEVLRLRGEKAARGEAVPAMSAYEYAPGRYGLEVPVGEHGRAPTLNDKFMSIKFIFAASHSRDRKGDFFEVDGMDCTNHKRGTGIVMLDHGKWCPWPVGKSKDHNRVYTIVTYSDQGLTECNSFMSPSLREADQAYRLYREEILGAGSVGYRIILAKPLPPDPEDGHFRKENRPAGLHLIKTELLEPTLCALPVNADCVGSIRKAMSMRWGAGGLADAFRARWQPYLTGKTHPATVSVSFLRRKSGPAMSATDQSGGGAFIPPASSGPPIPLKRNRKCMVKELLLVKRVPKRKAGSEPHPFEWRQGKAMPPKPKFTGIDSHGHQWVNGVQKKRTDLEKPVAEHAADAEEAATVPKMSVPKFEPWKSRSPDERYTLNYLMENGGDSREGIPQGEAKEAHKEWQVDQPGAERVDDAAAQEAMNDLIEDGYLEEHADENGRPTVRLTDKAKKEADPQLAMKAKVEDYHAVKDALEEYADEDGALSASTAVEAIKDNQIGRDENVNAEAAGAFLDELVEKGIIEYPDNNPDMIRKGPNWIGNREAGQRAKPEEKTEEKPATPTKAPSMTALEAAKKLPYPSESSVKQFDKTDIPLGQRLDRLADIDLAIMDPMYNSGLFQETGVKNNNEFLRQLFVGWQEWEDSLKSPSDKGRLQLKVSNKEEAIRQVVAGMRKWHAEGKHVKDSDGKLIDLAAAADLYEQVGKRAIDEIRQSAGLSKGIGGIGGTGQKSIIHPWEARLHPRGPKGSFNAGKFARKPAKLKDEPKIRRRSDEQAGTTSHRPESKKESQPVDKEKKPAGRGTEPEGTNVGAATGSVTGKRAEAVLPPSSGDERLKTLESSPFSSVQPPVKGGCNETLIVDLEGGGKGVWKPAAGEWMDENGDGLRKAVKPGTGYLREAAYWSLADKLDMGDLVPETTVRTDTDGRVGSIQRFIGKADSAIDMMVSEMADRSELTRSLPRALPAGDLKAYDGHEDASRAAILDYIAGHLDRHPGNWLVKDGKLVLIDNGLSLPSWYDAKDFRATNDLFLHHAIDFPMPDVSAMRDKWPEIEAELKRLNIDADAIHHAKARFEAVTKGGHERIGDLPSFVNPHDRLRDMLGSRKIEGKAGTDIRLKKPERRARMSPTKMEKVA
jgi:phosphoinositide 3-/4-kinase-like protein